MKNNSMINYLNNSYKYNKGNNVKLLPKTKSLNNFNKNALKLLRKANKLDYSNAEPVKIKANQEKTYLNQNFINRSKTPNKDVILNNMIQEYDYLNYMYENLKNTNLPRQKNRYKLKNQLIKRPKKHFTNSNMYNKIFRYPGYRPPSPMIEPGIRLVN